MGQEGWHTQGSDEKQKSLWPRKARQKLSIASSKVLGQQLAQILEFVELKLTDPSLKSL